MKAEVKSEFVAALPFWVSLGMVPLAVIGAVKGGLWVLLLPAVAWHAHALIDLVAGMNARNKSTDTDEADLFWYRLITLIWAPVQFATVFGLIAYVTTSGHLSWIERVGLFIGVGTMTGAIGITYAHELMHQPKRLDRWMGDILMSMVLYGHFRSEHLLVHHRYVGTPRDAVTARYNEGFHRFFPRVLVGCVRSSWSAEKEKLGKKGLPVWHRSNPFWRYGALQAFFVLLAAALGGWAGVALFLIQAIVAFWQLELVNYVEHYGLTRQKLDNGRYEHVQPRHSWNASHRVSNWVLINLQRHSDHHFKPSRPYPLLQTYPEDQAPQLPFGYPTMTMIAMVPPVWRRMMNPRVRAWRKTHYPDVEDWAAMPVLAN
ncbi:MAG: alkane 1-monooxygenase [Rhodobacteraceae bacterium]|nr:alkane 1-monooxygenase [Paracoccaceae bacterium]